MKFVLGAISGFFVCALLRAQKDAYFMRMLSIEENNEAYLGGAGVREM